MYLKNYETVREAREDLESYLPRFYNLERLHETLGYRTLHEVCIREERLTTTRPASASWMSGEAAHWYATLELDNAKLASQAGCRHFA